MSMKEIADDFQRLAEIKEALEFTEEVKAYAAGTPINFVGVKSLRWLVEQFEELREENRKLRLAALEKRPTNGVDLIARERQRQIEDEGWTAEHDDEHTDGSLVLAAVCFATPVKLYRLVGDSRFIFEDPWPHSWADEWDRRMDPDDKEYDESLPDPQDYSDEERIDLLIKAGALIAAEIDRLRRRALIAKLDTPTAGTEE